MKAEESEKAWWQWGGSICHLPSFNTLATVCVLFAAIAFCSYGDRNGPSTFIEQNLTVIYKGICNLFHLFTESTWLDIQTSGVD